MIGSARPSLLKNEHGNWDFDFLRPGNQLHSYFISLVEQYTKVLLPKQEMRDELARLGSAHEVLQDARYAAEWVKRDTSRKQAEVERAEKDRVSYAAIDWHDWVVVGTVEFGAEDTDLPTPVAMADLGARIIEVEKFEAEQKERERARGVGESSMCSPRRAVGASKPLLHRCPPSRLEREPSSKGC